MEETQSTQLSRRGFLAGVAGAAAITAAASNTKRLSAAEMGYSLADPDPPFAYRVMAKMAFGHRPSEIAAFNALSSNDNARLSAYVEQQLDPDSIDDSVCDDKIAALGVTAYGRSIQQSWQEIWNGPQAMKDLYGQTFIRAIYSKKQLQEMLADFWHNHFAVFTVYPGNIDQEQQADLNPKFDKTTGMAVAYDEQVIRPHIFGNFRDMLELNAKSAAMLYYLDQVDNVATGPNENYAREILELHALGAENSLGSATDAADVPRYDGTEFPEYPSSYYAGLATHYVDHDIFELTLALTGWSINEGNGSFEAKSYNHAPGSKTVLGRTLGATNDVEAEGMEVIDMVARHPGTAVYIARKLCRRFIADEPPESIVQSAATVFRANIDEPDQLKHVYRHIFNSSEFKNTWGEKVKRPLEYMASLFRALDVNLDDAAFTRNRIEEIAVMYNDMKQPIMGWFDPNGYPDKMFYWMNSNAMLPRWDLANAVTSGALEVDSDGESASASQSAQSWLYGTDVIDIMASDIGETVQLFGNDVLVIDRPPTGIVDWWTEYLLGMTLPADSALRYEFTRFVAQGRNHDFSLMFGVYDNAPVGSDVREIATFTRGLVGLILASPPFQFR